ncbi:hypothetical protein I6N90_07535 [Paenibacillus sp. GSMTC-2017]|uniref:hypothetical protein n=1 Tax=Paenibacillus sp. GSMTC-2017 TaxID=2794350 RepID=UPI0018D99ED4|nr:hypothetical protein [Paenibacillus sp. GSMTC-2017]MBH5317651.1 hypothetical protein [Paenibacillus sp. GSMTC-2017]
MAYLLVFSVFLFANIFALLGFGLPGILILNFAIISTALFAIYDKVNKATNYGKPTFNPPTKEEKEIFMKEIQIAKDEFDEKDLPEIKELFLEDESVNKKS